MTKQPLFVFRFTLEGPDICTDENADALYEAGLDDATIGCVNDEQFAIFSREAPSYQEALDSAICDVESAIEGLRVVRVDRYEEEEEPVTERAPGRVRRRGFRAVLSRWS
jgi:hypothetical protein